MKKKSPKETKNSSKKKSQVKEVKDNLIQNRQQNFTISKSQADINKSTCTCTCRHNENVCICPKEEVVYQEIPNENICICPRNEVEYEDQEHQMGYNPLFSEYTIEELKCENCTKLMQEIMRLQKFEDLAAHYKSKYEQSLAELNMERERIRMSDINYQSKSNNLIETLQKEKKELNIKIKNLTNEVQNLTNEINSIQYNSKIQEINKEANRESSVNNKSGINMEEFESIKEDYENKINELNQKVSDLNKEKNQAINIQNLLNKQVEEEKEIYDKMVQEFNRQIEEIKDKLKSEKETNKNLTDNLNKQLNENEELNIQLKAKIIENRKTCEALNATNYEQINSLKETLNNQVTEDKKIFEQLTANYTSQIEELQKQLAKQTDDDKASYDNMVKSYKAKIQNIQTQLTTQMEKDKKEYNQILDSLNKELSSLRVQMSKYKGSVDKLTNENAVLSCQLKNVQSTYNSETTEYKNQIKKLNEHLIKKYDEINRLNLNSIMPPSTTGIQGKTSYLPGNTFTFGNIASGYNNGQLLGQPKLISQEIVGQPQVINVTSLGKYYNY